MAKLKGWERVYTARDKLEYRHARLTFVLWHKGTHVVVAVDKGATNRWTSAPVMGSVGASNLHKRIEKALDEAHFNPLDAVIVASDLVSRFNNDVSSLEARMEKLKRQSDRRRERGYSGNNHPSSFHERRDEILRRFSN